MKALNLGIFVVFQGRLIILISLWIRAQAIEGDNNGKPLPKGREALSKYLSQWKKDQSSDRA